MVLTYDNLQNMRNFYFCYSMQLSENQNIDIYETLSRKSLSQFQLSWSHYLKLMRITDKNERNFYEIESFKNNWSLRELQRQYDSALYTRLALSKDKQQILELSAKGQIIQKAKDVIKDPYVLEFLGLPENSQYSESELEQKLITKLEHFMLELGKGFTFVGRQVRFTFDERHFRVDLVFYNRILQCFVLIDLKIGDLMHQDIGQMQMYVNYYDRFVRLETIGIILCQEKSEILVELTLPEDNEQIFTSRYQTILPSKEELKKLIENKE
jgi:predicted nuclease of restriction endonuclease-like (RecB) superfamily